MSWLPDWLTGFDRENYERGLEAERKSQELNKGLLERGLIDEQTFRESEANFARDDNFDPDAEINAGFVEGLNEGVNNVRGTIGSVVSFPFRLIPWQLWAIGAIALLVYMGGWARLAGMLKAKR